MSDSVAQENCACGYSLNGVYSGRCPECGRNVPVNRGSLISQYTERRLGWRLIYYLYPDTVVVHGHTLKSGRFVSPVSLVRLDPEIYTAWQYPPALKVALSSLASCAILIAVSLLNRDDKTGIQLVLMLASILIGFCSLLVTSISLRTIEYARFCMFERPILNIGRVGPDSDRFNDFISQVRKTILANRESKK